MHTARISPKLFTVLTTLLPAADALAAEDVVERIDAIVERALEEGPIASCGVAVVKDGRLVLARGYGYADLENRVPATAEIVYRLGSITKQFTATAVMQLVEKGRLAVDDDIRKHLSDFPTGRHTVTVHHLLTHTSGIPSYTGIPAFWKEARLDLSHEKLLAHVAEKPFDFPPWQRFKYNNTGYYLLGMIIERVSGQAYADYLEEHIFRPLGMHATRYGGHRPHTPIVRPGTRARPAS